MIVLALVGCLPKAGPPVYTTALPDLEPHPIPKALAEWTPKADECPQIVALLPGARPEVLDEDDFATCRAQLIPDSRVIELYKAEDAAIYWEKIARAGREGRIADRVRGQEVSDISHIDRRSLRTENLVLRVEGPLTAVAALLLGGVMGLAASELRTSRLEVFQAQP